MMMNCRSTSYYAGLPYKVHGEALPRISITEVLHMKKGTICLKTVWFYCPVILLVVIAILWGSRAVTAISESIVPDRGPCIIIDAGHGGEDGGATSCSGVLESHLNLDISMRLNDLLHFLGFETKMIRTTDSAVHTEGETIAARKRSDLNQRVKVANSTENALLVSIHQNTFPDGRYSGAQVFYAPTANSEDLAKQIQAAFLISLCPGSNRQAKRANGVFLMEHIQCPGVLVECGFLSNPEEEALLRSPGYQQKLCCVIASALSTYLSNT